MNHSWILMVFICLCTPTMSQLELETGYYVLPKYNNGTIITSKDGGLYFSLLSSKNLPNHTKKSEGIDVGTYYNNIYYMSGMNKLWWLQISDRWYNIWWQNNPYHLLNKPSITEKGIVKVKVPSAILFNGIIEFRIAALKNGRPLYVNGREYIYFDSIRRHWVTNYGKIIPGNRYYPGEAINWNLLKYITMDVVTSINDTRIKGAYKYIDGTWYNKDKGVYLYRDLAGEALVKNKSHNYTLFSIAKSLYVPVEDRLAFVESTGNFKVIDGIVTPVPIDRSKWSGISPLINGEIYGVPSDQVLKCHFKILR